MQITLERMTECLCEVFPECSDMALSIDTQLGELPEWDSMAAVNLQTILHQQFDVEAPLELLADQTKLQEIMDFLRNPVPTEAAY
jgi:acyl carrier protein